MNFIVVMLIWLSLNYLCYIVDINLFIHIYKWYINQVRSVCVEMDRTLVCMTVM